MTIYRYIPYFLDLSHLKYDERTPSKISQIIFILNPENS
jgi:hypothetical protein